MIKLILQDNRRLFLNVFWCVVGLSIFGIAIIRPALPFLLGLYFGAGISLLNFIEMAMTMQRAVRMKSHEAQRFATIKYLVRYALTAFALLVSFLSPGLNPFGTIMGLLVIKAVLYGTSMIQDRLKRKHNSSRKEE